jgi:hypothetical protein
MFDRDLPAPSWQPPGVSLKRSRRGGISHKWLHHHLPITWGSSARPHQVEKLLAAQLLEDTPPRKYPLPEEETKPFLYREDLV